MGLRSVGRIGGEPARAVAPHVGRHALALMEDLDHGRAEAELDLAAGDDLTNFAFGDFCLDLDAADVDESEELAAGVEHGSVDGGPSFTSLDGGLGGRLVDLEPSAQERGVSEIVEHVGVAQPTVSHHLAVLRDAGLVSVRHEGKQTFYTLNQDRMVYCCGQLMEYFAPGTVATEAVRQVIEE